MKNSYFDGGLFSSASKNILWFIITILSLGIFYPLAICMVYGRKINHTVVEGRWLIFNGSPIGLFGNWIKWLLLCIITFRIYSFLLFIALEKWEAKKYNFCKLIHIIYDTSNDNIIKFIILILLQYNNFIAIN